MQVANHMRAVKITKQCMVGGEVRAVGATLTVKEHDAIALIQMGRAVPAEMEDDKPATRTPKPSKRGK